MAHEIICQVCDRIDWMVGEKKSCSVCFKNWRTTAGITIHSNTLGFISNIVLEVKTKEFREKGYLQIAEKEPYDG